MVNVMVLLYVDYCINSCIHMGEGSMCVILYNLYIYSITCYSNTVNISDTNINNQRSSRLIYVCLLNAKSKKLRK